MSDLYKAAQQALHAAVCQAVTLLNRSPAVAGCAEGREAHLILRQALVDYADAYMDQPASDSERETVARKHRSRPLSTAPAQLAEVERLRAPQAELLSALKAALSALEFFAPEESPRTLAKVRAAIAKAEGQQ
jgi:hypothetical protein